MEFGVSCSGRRSCRTSKAPTFLFLSVDWPAYRRRARGFLGICCRLGLFFPLVRAHSNRTRPIMRAHVFSCEAFCFLCCGRHKKKKLSRRDQANAKTRKKKKTIRAIWNKPSVPRLRRQAMTIATFFPLFFVGPVSLGAWPLGPHGNPRLKRRRTKARKKFSFKRGRHAPRKKSPVVRSQKKTNKTLKTNHLGTTCWPSGDPHTFRPFSCFLGLASTHRIFSPYRRRHRE